MTKITKANFTRYLQDTGGNQSVIAGKIGCSRSAVTLFLDKHPDMRALAEQEAERIVDFAENLIESDIANNKNVDTAKWKLTNSKRGKARGYGLKTELEHSGGAQPITVNLVEKSVEDIKHSRHNNKPKAKTDASSSQ